MRYFVSLIKTSFKLRNLGILFFTLLNSALLFSFALSLLQTTMDNVGLVLAAFFVFNIVYYAFILGIGTFLIRILFGGNQIVMGNDTSSISVAFAEAYAIAKQKDPSLSDNVKLYACTTNYPDAYAFGRDTLLISEQASRLPQSQLRTLFLEKFAQFSNHDSERMLFLIAGNAIFVAAIFIIKIMVYVVVAFIGICMSAARAVLSLFSRRVGYGSGFLALSGYFNVCRVLGNAIEAVLLFLLNLLIRLALLSSRNNYYVNDEFVCACGYSSDLRYYLQYVEPDISGFQSTLATITAAKPSRLARLSRISEGSIHDREQNNLIGLFGNQGNQLEENRSSSFRVVSRTESNNHTSTSLGFRIVSRNDE